VRRSSEFTSIVRSGARARAGALVVHQLGGIESGARPRVGFVVSKAVGNSVTRHRVVRRLRAQTAARLDRLPSGSGTVVRALPAAAGAASSELGSALDRALAKLAGAR